MASSQSATRYELVPLGNLTAVAMNNSNQVVGYSYVHEQGYRGFLWQNGTIQNLGTIGEASSYPAAINNAGVIVGWVEFTNSLKRAVKFENGTAVDITGTFVGSSRALGINDAGVIVGSRGFFDAPTSLGPWQFAPSRKSILGYDGLANISSLEASFVGSSNQVILNVPGWEMMPSSVSTFTLPNSSRQSKGLWDTGEAFDMNDRGDTVGYGRTEYYRAQAVVWRGGFVERLASPAGQEAEATAINNRGQIAGHLRWRWGPRGEPDGAMLWENGMAYSVRNLIRNPEAILGAIINVAAMNDEGAIVVNAWWSPPPFFEYPASGFVVRPGEAFLLRPVEEVELPVVTLSSPSEETVVPAGAPVTISWRQNMDIESLSLFVQPVRRTDRFDPPGTESGSSRFKWANIPLPSSSITVANLPYGYVALSLEGTSSSGVWFATPSRVIRVNGDFKLVPSLTTFALKLEVQGDTNGPFEIEWSTNLTTWHPSDFSGFKFFGASYVPFLTNSAVSVRAVRLAEPPPGPWVP